MPHDWLLHDLNTIIVWAVIGVLCGIFCWFYDVQLQVKRRRK